MKRSFAFLASACALAALTAAAPAQADIIHATASATVEYAYQPHLELAGIQIEEGGTLELYLSFSDCTDATYGELGGDFYMLSRDAGGEVIDILDYPGLAYTIAHNDVFGFHGVGYELTADTFGSQIMDDSRTGVPFLGGVGLSTSHLDTIPGDPLDFLNMPIDASGWDLANNIAFGVAPDDTGNYYTAVIATVTSIDATASSGPACEEPPPPEPTCATDCLGGECLAGQCQPLEIAGGITRPAFLAVSATDVYFSATTFYQIIKAPLVPGPLSVVASGGDDVWGPTGVAVAGGYVLWATEQGGAIMRAAPDALDPSSQAIATGQGGPIGLTTDGGYVYWANYSSGTLARSRITAATDSAVEVIATGQDHPWGVAVRDGYVYWTNSGHGGVGGTVMRKAVGRVAPRSELVEESPRGGLRRDRVQQLASGGTPYALVTDATSVYWVDGSAVRKVPLAGGTVESLATWQNYPYGITVDAEHVFWTNYGGGNVMRAGLDGADPVEVASGQHHPYQMAQDDLAIYWINDEWQPVCDAPPCGGVMKLAK